MSYQHSTLQNLQPKSKCGLPEHTHGGASPHFHSLCALFCSV